MLYSFDVFDTILYRVVPKSTDIFMIMEKDFRLKEMWKKANTKETFSNCRRKAEFWLRRTCKKEITINDIYNRLLYNVGLPLDNVVNFIEIEMDTEMQNSFLNEKVVKEIKKLILKGERVVLISDMYWNESAIRTFLTSKDEFFEKIPLYISCEINAKKVNGGLYKFVAEKENTSYFDWIHVGDSKIADYYQAKRLGITSKLVSGPKVYDFEYKFERCSLGTKKIYGLIVKARQKSTGKAFDLGLSFSAPMVYQYVEWVVEQAREKKIQKLYFVLRDGYILKKVADIIISKRHLDIETEYIFGSRVAWRFPNLTIEKLKNLSVWEKSNWIFRDPAFAFVPFERLGFSKKELGKLLGEDFCQQKYCSFFDFKAGLDKALLNEEFCYELQKKIRQAGENLSLYLSQTIDSKKVFALVDTNSTGKTQRDLNKYIQEKNSGLGPIKFFYHTYLSDDEIDKSLQFVFSKTSEQDRRFPEALFRAPYKPCYGYVNDGARVKPQYSTGKYCAWNYSFDYEKYLDGIIEFAEACEAANREEIDIDGYVDVLTKVANFDIVSMDEIKQVGKMPFNPDMEGNEILDFYPKLHLRSLFHPFTELIYYPKGSYYLSGRMWRVVYSFLYQMVKFKRKFN